MGNYSVEEVIGDVGRYDVGDGGGDDELGEKTPNVGLPLLSSLDYKLFVWKWSIIPIHFQRIKGLEMEAYHVGPCVADMELILGRPPESPGGAVDLGGIRNWVFISERDRAS
ncbi:hypothetical protein ACFX1Z_004753 [Malus domestica]